MPDDREDGQSVVADALMASTRRLMLAATTTTLSDQQLLREAERLDEISSLLETRRASRMRRVRFTAERREELRAGTPWRWFPYNALGIPQAIEVGDGEARSQLQLSAVHEGPPGMLHGGFGAAILDAVLGVLVMAEVTPALTAELTISFHRPTPIGEPVEVHGRVVEIRPRTVIAEGSISLNGRTTLSARGVFVPLTIP